MRNEIIDGLYIGDYQDALDCPKDWVSINVAYEHLDTLPDSIYLPIMVPIDKEHIRILGEVLEVAANNIDRNLRFNKKVLVNCNMGQERAPLTVMYFLWRKRKMPLSEAYALVKKGRPQTQDRLSWIKDMRVD